MLTQEIYILKDKGNEADESKVGLLETIHELRAPTDTTCDDCETES